MKKLLSIICALFLLISCSCLTAFAAETTTLETITLSADVTDTLTLSGDQVLDLNGHNVANIVVTSGTVYCKDSQTDDYSVTDGIYGKIASVTGKVAAAEGYLQIAEGEKISFHKVNAEITAMSLRANVVGVYYKSVFAGDTLVADRVAEYGIALSVKEEPNAKNIGITGVYSSFTNFADGTTKNGTLLKNILKTSNSSMNNVRNANMTIYGRPYILTTEGEYIFGETVTRSLREQIEGVDALWTSYGDAAKETVLWMNKLYGEVMNTWNITNIKASSDEQQVIRVGYGNTVITPLPEHGALTLGGHNEEDPYYTTVEDDLPCTCVALTDLEGNTVLVYSLETLKTYDTILKHIPAISEATGVPRKNIMISATHCHNAPNIFMSMEENKEYIKYVGEQMVKAAELAMADQRIAKAYTNSTKLEGYNFGRHYIMENGAYCTTTEWPQMVAQGLKPVAHVVEVDNQLQLIKFERVGGKDVVLMNWQGHPNTSVATLEILSATEQMRKVFAEEDQLLIHFNGASGDSGYNSRIESENKFAGWRENYTAVAEEALKLDSTYQAMELGSISVLSQVVDNPGREIDIYGISFGDAAILFAPCEMFNDTGKNIKAGSPFETTIIASNAMGNHGYIPTAATYAYGGYEVGARYNGIENGTAEILEAAFVEMASNLKGN